jgi:Tfp pilus assembly protein PilX
MKHNPQHGVAIITVMCFIMVLTALATVAARSVGTHVKIAADQVDMETAFYTAEAGAERGAAHVANGGVVPHSFSGQLGDGFYYVTISGKASVGVGSGTSVNGLININPNNSPQNQFVLTLPGGGTITRNDLTQNYGGYVGQARAVRVKPKGNGNQNGLTVDGQTYVIHNSTTYEITSSAMAVNLFNDKINKQGKAIGHWHISIGATDATITPPP